MTEVDSLSGNITCSIADHLAQFAIINKKINSKKQTYMKKRRNYSNFNKEDFIMDILAVDWETKLKLNKNNINTDMKCLINITNNILNKHAPLKNYTSETETPLHQPKKPWITKGILTSIKKRDKFYKKFITEKNIEKKQSYHEKYKTYRNVISQLNKNSKTQYFQSFFALNKKNLKKTWSGIKSLINSKGIREDIPNYMKNNNISLNSST